MKIELRAANAVGGHLHAYGVCRKDGAHQLFDTDRKLDWIGEA